MPAPGQESLRWLVSQQGKLRVAGPRHGPLVDVGAANYDRTVVHYHQLGVDVDHEPPALSEQLCPAARLWSLQVVVRNVLRPLLLDQTVELKVVSRVTWSPVEPQRVANPETQSVSLLRK